MRVLFNVCFGGFSIKDDVLVEAGLAPTYDEIDEYNRQQQLRYEALRAGLQLPDTPLITKYSREKRGRTRTNPTLIERVLSGENIAGDYSKIGVTEFDDAFDNFWYAREYDGAETITLDKSTWMRIELEKLGGQLPDHELISKWKRMLAHEPTILLS